MRGSADFPIKMDGFAACATVRAYIVVKPMGSQIGAKGSPCFLVPTAKCNLLNCDQCLKSLNALSSFIVAS